MIKTGHIFSLERLRRHAVASQLFIMSISVHSAEEVDTEVGHQHKEKREDIENVIVKRSLHVNDNKNLFIA